MQQLVSHIIIIHKGMRAHQRKQVIAATPAMQKI